MCAGGVAVTWLVDTSGDWMHLLPGVTAIALMAVAVLCYREPVARAADQRRHHPVRTSQRRGTAGALQCRRRGLRRLCARAAGASLMRSGLSQIYLDDAQGNLASNPAAALKDANRALRLDGANLNSYYIKAAALARFDEADASRAVLLQATGVQPSNYVSWVLLGDLEVRAGDIPLARHYYGIARALDPNDPSLAALVANPRMRFQVPRPAERRRGPALPSRPMRLLAATLAATMVLVGGRTRLRSPRSRVFTLTLALPPASSMRSRSRALEARPQAKRDRTSARTRLLSASASRRHRLRPPVMEHLDSRPEEQARRPAPNAGTPTTRRRQRRAELAIPDAARRDSKPRQQAAAAGSRWCSAACWCCYRRSRWPSASPPPELTRLPTWFHDANKTACVP